MHVARGHITNGDRQLGLDMRQASSAIAQGQTTLYVAPKGSSSWLPFTDDPSIALFSYCCDHSFHSSQSLLKYGPCLCLGPPSVSPAIPKPPHSPNSFIPSLSLVILTLSPVILTNVDSIAIPLTIICICLAIVSTLRLLWYLFISFPHLHRPNNVICSPESRNPQHLLLTPDIALPSCSILAYLCLWAQPQLSVKQARIRYMPSTLHGLSHSLYVWKRPGYGKCLFSSHINLLLC